MTMALRQVTKRDSHFLVRYLSDQKFQIRTAGFFQSNEKIVVGRNYEVMWGMGKAEVETATVLASGSEQEMRSELTRQKKTVLSRASASEQPKKRQKTQHKKTDSGKRACQVISRFSVKQAEETATEAREESSTESVISETTVTPQNTTSSENQAASENTVVPKHPATSENLAAPKNLAASENQAASKNTAASENQAAPVNPAAPENQAAPVNPAAPENLVPVCTTQASSVHGEEARTPSRGNVSPFSARLARPNAFPSYLQTTINTIEASNRAMAGEVEKIRRQGEGNSRRLDAMESSLRTLHSMTEQVLALLTRREVTTEQVDPTLEGEVTSDFALSEDEVRSIHQTSANAGNFAANLVRRLFPELFGVGNLKMNYNWYGGGLLKKKELCQERKNLVKMYVCRFYPEVKDENVWKDRIVPRVNELLRRKPKTERQKTVLLPGTSEFNTDPVDISNTSFTGLLEYALL